MTVYLLVLFFFLLGVGASTTIGFNSFSTFSSNIMLLYFMSDTCPSNCFHWYIDTLTIIIFGGKSHREFPKRRQLFTAVFFLSSIKALICWYNFIIPYSQSCTRVLGPSIFFSYTGKDQNFRKFQEYTTGTTFEPKKCYEEVKPTMVKLDMPNKQATMH